jgi:hypothetical protein
MIELIDPMLTAASAGSGSIIQQRVTVRRQAFVFANRGAAQRFPATLLPLNRRL